MKKAKPDPLSGENREPLIKQERLSSSLQSLCLCAALLSVPWCHITALPLQTNWLESLHTEQLLIKTVISRSEEKYLYLSHIEEIYNLESQVCFKKNSNNAQMHLFSCYRTVSLSRHLLMLLLIKLRTERFVQYFYHTTMQMNGPNSLLL